MKKFYTFIFWFLAVNFSLYSQNKEKVIVLNVDVQGLKYTPEQMGNLLRIELDKLDTFEVVDRYDVSYLVKKNKLDISDCYGKICLVEVGKSLGADKMLSGSVEVYEDILFLTLRLINVKTERIEKSIVGEYLNLPEQLQLMIRMNLYKMFDKPIDSKIENSLTGKNQFETGINNPETAALDLNGPRMGGIFYTGEVASILQKKTAEGGFDVYPLMFQFGYQYEKQYLNQGNFQALFEIIPLVTGLDQNKLIPSITFMNGMRNSLWGLELAFGPTFNVVKQAKGYFEDNQWHLEEEWLVERGDNPNEIIYRLDSRGKYRLGTGFIFGFGKTFKSGRLNIPVNFYVMPAIGNSRFGFSVGYNAQRRFYEGK